MPAADFGPIETRLAGGETGLDQEELVEDQSPHRRHETRPLRRKMDLVHGVVQIGQAVAHEHVRWQRVEYTAGSVEGAVDQGPHPPGLYALVDGIDGHESSRMGSFVATGILDDLDAFGGQLDTVTALYFAGGDHPHLGKQLSLEPAPAPDHHGDVASAVVELGREAWRAPPDRLAHGARGDDSTEDRGPLSDAQLGDPLHVGKILVARRIVGDHICQRGYAEVAQGTLDPWPHAG